MNREVTLPAGGVGSGAALMYILDPIAPERWARPLW